MCCAPAFSTTRLLKRSALSLPERWWGSSSPVDHFFQCHDAPPIGVTHSFYFNHGTTSMSYKQGQFYFQSNVIVAPLISFGDNTSSSNNLYATAGIGRRGRWLYSSSAVFAMQPAATTTITRSLVEKREIFFALPCLRCCRNTFLRCTNSFVGKRWFRNS